jgi:hypothetical protein
MYSVYNYSLPSSSRHIIDDCWENSPRTYSFPTSDLRSADRWSPSIIQHSRNLTLSDRNASECPTASKYSNVVPRRTQIAPGVWSDGRNLVLSAACPDVQAFLTCAREEMNLPVAPSERVFALAALEVFYRTDDPVHWMFWSERSKDETAEVVNRISRTCDFLLSDSSYPQHFLSSVHRPPLIHSRVAWNGISEYLFILASLHGPTSSPLYQAKDWYLILNPPKAASPPRVPNLRKRKPQQAGLRETPASVDQEGFDEEEPPAKRQKTKRTPNSKKPRRSKDNHDPVVNENHADPWSSSVSPKDLDNVSIPAGDCEVPVEPSSLTTRAAARKSKNAALETTPTPDSSTPVSSTTTSTLVSSPSHSRNRSTSQTSSETSSKTLVAERRSASVLSAATTVEVPTVGKEEAQDSNGDQVADDDSDSGGKPDSEAGMVTRGRASKARTTAGKISEVGKVVKASTRGRPKGRAKRNAKRS